MPPEPDLTDVGLSASIDASPEHLPPRTASKRPDTSPSHALDGSDSKSSTRIHWIMTSLILSTECCQHVLDSPGPDGEPQKQGDKTSHRSYDAD